MVTAALETLQAAGVLTVKLTGKPEEVSVEMANGLDPYVTLLSGPNVSVCDHGVTLKAWATGAAAK